MSNRTLFEDFENPSIVEERRIVVPTMEVTCLSNDIRLIEVGLEFPTGYPGKLEGKILELNVRREESVTHHLRFNFECSTLSFWMLDAPISYAVFNAAGEQLGSGVVSSGTFEPTHFVFSAPGIARIALTSAANHRRTYVDNFSFAL